MTKVPHRDIVMNCWIGIMVDYTTKIFHKGSFESRHRENLPVLRHDTEQGQSDVKNPKFGILMRCRGFDTNGKCVLAEKRAEQMVQTSRPAKSFQWARNIIPMGTEPRQTWGRIHVSALGYAGNSNASTLFRTTSSERSFGRPSAKTLVRNLQE